MIGFAQRGKDAKGFPAPVRQPPGQTYHRTEPRNQHRRRPPTSPFPSLSPAAHANHLSNTPHGPKPVRCTMAMKKRFLMRNAVQADGETFFLNEQDAEANRIAGYVPRARKEFFASWEKSFRDPTGTKQTIVVNDQVIGFVSSFERNGRLEVGFRIGREYWGKGIATRALTQFLTMEKRRPLYAGASKTNRASIRVLEKCGFAFQGQDQYMNRAGEEIAGFLFRLGPSLNQRLEPRAACLRDRIGNGDPTTAAAAHLHR